MYVPLKTLWEPRHWAGINEERYVKPALARGECLSILLLKNGEIMELTPEQVTDTQVGRSERTFQDQYGGPDYYLVYYKWKATAKQGVLI